MIRTEDSAITHKPTRKPPISKKADSVVAAILAQQSQKETSCCKKITNFETRSKSRHRCARPDRLCAPRQQLHDHRVTWKRSFNSITNNLARGKVLTGNSTQGRSADFVADMQQPVRIWYGIGYCCNKATSCASFLLESGAGGERCPEYPPGQQFLLVVDVCQWLGQKTLRLE